MCQDSLYFTCTRESKIIHLIIAVYEKRQGTFSPSKEGSLLVITSLKLAALTFACVISGLSVVIV